MSAATEKIRVRSPWRIFVAVIKALFLREMGVRISSGRSGLFWTFAEPFIQVAIFIAIHALIFGEGTTSTPYDYNLFLASGFIAFNMFRGILNASTGAFVANRGLFVYKQVKPIDTMISRALVEMFLTMWIIFVFIIVGFFLNYDMWPSDFLMVVAGYLWIALFGLGLGILLGTANTFYMSVGKLVAISSFILMLTSAVFFPVDSVPVQLQDILLYNPLVHFIEMIHAGYLANYPDRYIDYSYMFVWTIVPMSLGLWYYRKLEKKIIAS